MAATPTATAITLVRTIMERTEVSRVAEPAPSATLLGRAGGGSSWEKRGVAAKSSARVSLFKSSSVRKYYGYTFLLIFCKKKVSVFERFRLLSQSSSFRLFGVGVESQDRLKR
jgi:hypothetical protein